MDPIIGVIMGSRSDLSHLSPGIDLLKDWGVPIEVEVVSAHRTPERMFEYAKTARDRGLKVIIACAGGAAHLPGMVASLTTLPVIGVPRASDYFRGADSLLSIVQMPPGVPVATVGVGNGTNAALLALRVLGVEDSEIAEKLEGFRRQQQEKVSQMNSDIASKLTIEEAQAQVEKLVSESDAESVSVAYMPVREGEPFFIEPDEPYHAASTMKVCVLMELFHQAEQGLLSLDQKVKVHNSFPSAVDGKLFEVDKEDDSYKPLYELIGQEQTLLELARPMITHSSNFATNLIIEQVGVENINNYMKELGADGLVVRRYIEDREAYRQGVNSMVTARGLATILRKLAKGEVVSKAASKKMAEFMRAQSHRNCIPAKLPKRTTVANKPGWNTGITHDCGILGPNILSSIFSLAVLTKGLEHDKAADLIASIAAIFWETRERPISYS